jgi:hypothetical protein
MKPHLLALSLLAFSFANLTAVADDKSELQAAQELVATTIRKVSEGNSTIVPADEKAYLAREALARDLAKIDGDFGKIHKKYIAARKAATGSQNPKAYYPDLIIMVAELRKKAPGNTAVAAKLKAWNKAEEAKEDLIGSELAKSDATKAEAYKKALELTRKTK